MPKSFIYSGYFEVNSCSFCCMSFVLLKFKFKLKLEFVVSDTLFIASVIGIVMGFSCGIWVLFKIEKFLLKKL